MWNKIQKCHASENPVFYRAEVFASASSAKGIGTDSQQREADGSNHACRHNRSNDFQPELRKKSQDSLHNSTNQNSAHNCTIAILRSDNAQNGNKGKANAHDNRQAGTNLMENGKQLHQRSDTSDEHGALNQRGKFLVRQTACTADN